MSQEALKPADGCYVFGFALNGDGGGSLPAGIKPSEKPLWLHIDYSVPDSDEWLRRAGVPDKVIDSLVRTDTRPRTLILEEGALLILRTINVNPGQRPEDMVSLRLWIEKDRIISVRQRRIYSTQELKTLLEEGKGPRDVQELVVMLIERIADHVANFVDTIEEELAGYEEEIESGDAARLRTSVSTLRREVAAIRRYLSPERDALESFSRQAKNLMNQEYAYQVHEQSDRIVRFVEDLDLVRERALVLQEELMNRMAQELNVRLFVLSLVAAVFLPISFITGIFGMNVAGLPGLEDPRAFILVIALMVVVALGILGVFKVKQWL